MISLGAEAASSGAAKAKRPRHTGLVAIVTGFVVLALLPILSLIWIALTGSVEDLSHVVTTVLPGSLRTTLLLMALVAFFTASIGVISAWLVSGFEFPLRRMLSWMLVPSGCRTSVSGGLQFC